MKLIKPKFEILIPTGDIAMDIEIAARTCYKSEDRITDTSASKMVDALIKNGHTAMLEHGTVYLQYNHNSLHPYIGSNLYEKYKQNKYSESHYDYINRDTKATIVTTNYRVLIEQGWLDDLQYQCEPTKYHEKRISVRFTCDRGVSHEFVRHRVFSFAQESTRYCNYSKAKYNGELTFILPCWMDDSLLADGIEDPGQTWDYESVQLGLGGEYEDTIKATQKDWIYLGHLCDCEDTYLFLMGDSNGWTAEQARAALPNGLKTEIIMTGFANDWKGFFKLRDATTAHPQAFELAHPLHEEFIKRGLL